MFIPQARTFARGLVLAAVAAMLLVLLAGTARAADGARIQEVTTEEGTVTFLLTAVGLAPEENLDAESVQVTIDGQSVAASAETAGETAVQRTVYLVMDTSGSMQGLALSAAKNAGRQYLESVPADVAVGLVTFADDAAVAVPATEDRAAVARALDATEASGSTALFDAAVLAAEQLGDTGSRSLVLLSDGEDEGSSASEQQALAAITSSGVAVDAVALTDGVGAEQLSRMAQAGGGVAVQVADADTLTAAFASAAKSASTQLLVTADLPSGQEPGTFPMGATVEVAGQQFSDEAVVVIDAEAAAAAAAASAADVGPIPVETRSVGFMQQGWFLPTLIAVLFAALAMIALLAFRLISEDALEPRRQRRRIDAYGVEQAASQVRRNGDSQSAIAQRAVAVAEQVVTSRDPDRVLERKLAAAGMPLKPAEWTVLHVAIALTGTLVAAAASGFSVLWTLIGLGLGAFLPYAVLDIKASSRRKEFYTALPDVLQLLAGSVASGYSFLQAVDTVAEQSQGVVATEFGRAVAEARLGIPVEDSLTDVAERMGSRDFEWVIMAVRINRRVGGNLAEVLRTVAKTLRERERLRRHVSALTAEGRLSAIILGAMPFLMTGYMVLVRPEYIGLLLTNPVGWIMILLGVALLVVGMVWMRQTIKLEV